MFEKILVAIDDGAPAARALDIGIELAEQLKAKICALHVIDVSRAFHSDPQVFDEGAMANLRQEAQRVLNDASARAPQILEMDRLSGEGDPPEVILGIARNWGADLVVIGTDSRGRLAHFLLGSTADAVIRRAPCPVMAVRADAATGTKRLGAAVAAV